MFGSSDGLPFSRHSDVLHATPTDDDSLVRLVEELKRRGNAAFASKAYEEAEVLYSRAIDINTNNPLKNQHVFFANRSASRCSMGKNALALEDANACIALVGQYAKGYFRKAQALKALKQYKEALVVIGTAKALDPQNKSLSTLQTQLQDLAIKQVEAPVAPTKPVERKVTRIGVVKEGDASPASSKAVVGTSAVDGEGGLGNVRGYKKLADGRVTTFFNNELTEEAKRLIGDIAPKKVDDSSAVQIKNVEGGSAWNVGNTFEEKDMTGWATGKIPSLLSGLSTPLGTAAGTITVSDVKDVLGEASIAVFRGKKRYIFGYSFVVVVTARMDDGATVDGELKFLDMSSDSDGDYDVDVAVPSRYQSVAGKAVHSALSYASSPFRAALTAQLNNFVVEFHNH